MSRRVDEVDPPIEALIGRWMTQPRTAWEEVVGHERAIRRLRELVALLGLAPAERARLGLRLGAGVALLGDPGVGKSLLARALATELGRPVVAPPPGELTPARIAGLYRALAARPEPTLVVLDEAEGLIGNPMWVTVDEDARRALLAALDGIERPEAAPVTVALTATGLSHLDQAALRPGRLAPALILDPPGPAERAVLFERTIAGLPGADGVDVARLVERTAGWTGAGIAEAVREAMRRSLVPGPAGLAMAHLLEVVGERFVVREPQAGRADLMAASRHEAGHVLLAIHAWGPEAVALVEIDEDGDGHTQLVESIRDRRLDAAELRRHIGCSLAGMAAELVCFGREGLTAGSARDLERATHDLVTLRAMTLPYDEDVLEGHRGAGADEMRRARHRAVKALGGEILAEVIAVLAPMAADIERIGDAIAGAPGRSLAGEALLQRIASPGPSAGVASE